MCTIQANRIERWTENRFVAEKVTIESPCSSIEESDWKPVNCEVKPNYMMNPSETWRRLHKSLLLKFLPFRIGFHILFHNILLGVAHFF